MARKLTLLLYAVLFIQLFETAESILSWLKPVSCVCIIQNLQIFYVKQDI